MIKKTLNRGGKVKIAHSVVGNSTEHEKQLIDLEWPNS